MDRNLVAFCIGLIMVWIGGIFISMVEDKSKTPPAPHDPVRKHKMLFGWFLLIIGGILLWTFKDDPFGLRKNH